MKRHLGELELFTLLALIRLKDEAYGVAIAREIEANSGRSVALGSIYAALERMENEPSGQLITSRMGESTPERGGKAKRYFSITPHGLERVRAMREALTSMWRNVPAQGFNA